MKLPFYHQLDSFDCGPTCLKIISEYYGRRLELEELREKSFITKEGVSLLGVSQAAEKIGFRTLIVKTDTETLIEECPLPAILHWNEDHFIVLYSIKKKKGNKNEFIIADPAHGIYRIDERTFKNSWLGNDSTKGICLLLEPKSNFYNIKKPDLIIRKWAGLLHYLRPFKKQIIRVAVFISVSTLIAFTFPFITQYLIDEGVMKKNYNIVMLLIASQLILFGTSSTLNVIRSRLLINVNAKISLHIVSDFLKKLLSLPIKFFDSKSVGDVSQRIVDHHRIETFLTGDLINSFFSLIHIVILSIILYYYGILIGIIFTIFSLLGIFWIFLFQKKRKQLDYIRFNRSKITQEKLHELIYGIQEIKLYGNEETKRWEWEYIQQKLYGLNIKSLILEQWQQSGFIFMTHLKNIIILYFVSLKVMEDSLSIGIMLSISYIIGQTNAPLEQLVDFFKSGQNANLSLERMLEVQNKESENNSGEIAENKKDILLRNGEIKLENVSFQYNGPKSSFVLKNFDLTIYKGKVTAIVGASGSGKTTLLKLLLGFYAPIEGKITINGFTIDELGPAWWRSQCATVMQEGYIFYDTIERNIAFDGKEIDYNRFNQATEICNLHEFVDLLPMGFKTRIGTNGMGLSGGQKQRILIARAIYKNPSFLFFDEATSSLDANNEKSIISKMKTYLKDKTVIIIAHRLSTVKNADQIIVLDKGKIKESGTHNQLIKNRNIYYELVSNQLDII
ncbi:peptidase domain-containing ABC transporter [Cecembia rubra]|uniref:ATP-binding cassette subfamily B protein n=1 Tax=Cecembia rubra TaxID=1485585 RepID=A0A2P8DWQ7_9BACT|nr:peptidase domain-containing ABC transporter [Cecembia rubra]PSL01659.1 ATP-binding cassette subfamily B protein [Cecembia rubra]